MRYLIDMEAIRDGRVVHPSLLIKAEGDPTVVPGKIGNAIQLDGNGQYLDLGQHTEKCLGNLARCVNGMTISAWMNFRSYSNNMYYISTGENGIHMYYRNGYIYVELSQPGRAWRITVPRFEPNRWYFIEMTWHRDDGLRLYVNNRLVGKGKLVDFRETSIDIGPNFYVGKANPGDLTSTRPSYADVIIDEMEFWEGRRDELLAFDYIQRGMYAYYKCGVHYVPLIYREVCMHIRSVVYITFPLLNIVVIKSNAKLYKFPSILTKLI